jgi:hypothetical protein
VHRVGEDEALSDDAASVSDLLHLGVEPEVRVATLQGPATERIYLLVQALADARDLGLRDPEPERLHHLVHLARRDAGDVRLLDHGHERLL